MRDGTDTQVANMPVRSAVSSRTAIVKQVVTVFNIAIIIRLDLDRSHKLPRKDIVLNDRGQRLALSYVNCNSGCAADEGVIFEGVANRGTI